MEWDGGVRHAMEKNATRVGVVAKTKGRSFRDPAPVPFHVTRELPSSSVRFSSLLHHQCLAANEVKPKQTMRGTN